MTLLALLCMPDCFLLTKKTKHHRLTFINQIEMAHLGCGECAVYQA